MNSATTVDFHGVGKNGETGTYGLIHEDSARQYPFGTSPPGIDESDENVAAEALGDAAVEAEEDPPDWQMPSNEQIAAANARDEVWQTVL